MTSLLQPHRRATTWIVIGVAVLLAVVATGLTISLLTKLPTGTGPSATESLLASVTSGPSATPLASSSSTASASATPAEIRPASWAATGNMATPRTGHTATLLIDGQVLVAGGSGSNGSGALDSAELYDPRSGSWIPTGSMIEARGYGHTATVLRDGRVLVTGGWGSVSLCSPTPCRGSADQPTASAELYDPSRGTWSATGQMAAGRSLHTATLLPDGRVLVVGGGSNSGGTALASAELYDPSIDSWTATGSMADVRFGHTATLLRDGKVLVAGGFNGGGPLASAELYDPSTGTWTATGHMNAARAKYTATLLLDGRVLVVGLGPPASAELYDPGSGSWTATGTMVADHGIHTATLLLNGKVLVAGGSGSGYISDLLAIAELYDPGTGSWTATGSMIEPREENTATLLRDGKVLVAGGNNRNPDASASAELYDPGTGN
jgi:N-acetylneuraminic acid mutarotase